MVNMESDKPETKDLESEPLYWLDNPRHVNWLCYGLYVACALLFVLDLFGLYEKHAHFDFENWIGFFGFFGFMVFFFLVLAATQLRRVLTRREDYYDR